MAKKTTTASAPASILQNIINNKTVTTHMAYLWERWQDEKEYEDFNEYVTNLEMVALEQGLTLVSLNSRPFCATFQAEEGMVAVITCKAKGNKLAFEGVTKPAKLAKAKRTKASAKLANTFVADGAEEAAETHEDAPSACELEERLNDLESGIRKGVGRGYANAGKKYAPSGVRVEEFKIGKAKVKKGDRLFFKIGKEEVVGVFSHLNQCVHCPEGYVVIRFGGKNYERRQSRVSTHATEAE